MSDDEDHDVRVAQMNKFAVLRAKALERHHHRLLEQSNPATFDKKFTGEPRDTLPFIFAAKQFLRVHGFRSERARFNRIFSSMPEAYRTSFYLEYGPETEEEMDSADESYRKPESKETFENLVKWMLQKYPPPSTKHDFVFNLKADKQRRNEAPWIVYHRYKHKLRMIQRSLRYINMGRAHKDRVSMVSKEQQLDALKSIFIRKNNDKEWDTDGVINKLTMKYID